MASVKYSRLPMADGEESLAFDYSSPFTFEDNAASQWRYRSAFTYGDACGADKGKFSGQDKTSNFSSDRFARFLIMMSFSIVFILLFPIMVWFSFKRVSEHERLVVFRLGRLHKPKGPGLVFLCPLLDRYHKIDVRLKAFSVPPKQLITGDGAIIEVGADIYFQIKDAQKSVTNVQNLDRSTRILVQTALCNILTRKSLAEIESERRIIADALLINSNKTCVEWGVEITRAEMSQIKVLSGPQPRKAPSLMMPPGMFGNISGEATAQATMPAAFAQLASALMAPQGPSQAQAISEALQTLACPGLSPDQKPMALNPSNDDLAMLLGPGDHRQSYPSYAPMEGTAAAGASALPVVSAAPVFRPDDILAVIRDALCEEVVAKIQETYQFDISGARAGTYYLNLRDGKGAIGPGPDPSGDPAATLSLTLEDLQAMLVGELKPFQAYMSGRLRVSGDTAAALKLEVLGNRIQALSQAGQASC